MRQFTRIFALTLIVGLMVLTSQTMAVARGQAAATGQMTLCLAHGTQVVTVDAEGNPTLGGQFCPDCVLTPWAAASGAAIPDRPKQISKSVVVPLVALTQGRIGDRRLGARDPPTLA
ncbi:hypothetical protein [Algirhabdus cladophorae]|uniref:hypothetical protein n=1 Tax=Algirhabdus cladophorae TaxID=3377108 RepID=UPI003B84A35E